MGWAEAGSVSGPPQLPCSSGHCPEAATQLPSGVGVGVGVFLLGLDALGGVSQASCLQGVRGPWMLELPKSF